VWLEEKIRASGTQTLQGLCWKTWPGDKIEEKGRTFCINKIYYIFKGFLSMFIIKFLRKNSLVKGE
jgi:hypothetical protein